ncbi:hypothetical protein PQR02_22285 [Paraburkholderia sediminicola]|uniref:Uncharacterized protein n=1 Tax=Paraburkholderia rhynchosiae TaxID=487049 RepID=A0ACC7NCS3_9BURK
MAQPKENVMRVCNAGEFYPSIATLNALHQLVAIALVSLVMVDAKLLAYKTV